MVAIGVCVGGGGSLQKKIFEPLAQTQILLAYCITIVY